MNPRSESHRDVEERDPLRLVLSIGAGVTLPEEASPASLGFKAWNLARMAAMGLPVPAAFVIGTGWCGREAPDPCLWQQALQRLERESGLGFGDARRPLLLSVRSGAPVSMPGMMDTLLDIGLTEVTLPGLVRLTGNPRLAWDAYRRLIAGYGEVVAGIDGRHFEADLDAVRGDGDEHELDFAALRDIAKRHLATYAREAGEAFPQDPQVQLRAAVVAVFASWYGDKARAYRELHELPASPGTAVTVQRMVFGNAGGMSGAGVGFTRDPSSGEPSPWVDFLFNAQGEDVVSGRRRAQSHEELAAVAPQIWEALLKTMTQLEQGFGDMQDFEFTVQDGQLYLLQTRDGKRTPQAAARIALDLCDQGLIPRRIALERTRGLDARALAVRRLVSEAGRTVEPLARATSAAGGVVCGEIALDEARVRARKEAGASVLLVRRDAETRDLPALHLADGLLTQRGARTSHAAVVARQLGKVCLVGCDSLTIDEADRSLSIGGLALREGDPLTLDGNEGVLYAGAARMGEQVAQDLLERLERLRHEPH
ncbi:pyruvate, phosphate dikinase [Azotobacter vinelandii CA]|uniref:Pyruvate, phosphate dikinase n=2 Tax=Azotobacter vinelandii TaxID=354 RepID=C1DDM7_AZOVD|nr:PEP/pyruvate-binding domain-containing protein [Azotobacter vinelandii]ACO77998.1 pyruvate, phosphate dikinase [Azotobacter vinelandii DJ]AGK13885.1 pyruvate, phosphate dikinase [Azotobacter vinelandii CA]AGK18547.1 pyruvate, phosphate dikinase [Azotobacter vinelandii CA6]SFX91774.1 pyruvate phosphate dikinase [Azotobacter vinelandii]GLK61932.1 pyruvate, phosphate dikinase [Azotobacter vinelandii]